MANIVDAFMKKMEFPEKMELSEADRKLILNLEQKVLEMNQQIKEDKQALEEMTVLLQELKQKEMDKATEQPEKEELNKEEIKILFEETSTVAADQIKALVADRTAGLDAKINSIRANNKGEEVVKNMLFMQEQMRENTSFLKKQIGGVKIMVGVSIWSALLSLAVLVAFVLGFI